ncbi:phosphoribosylanthranilate isomerase [Acuticoccus mangrovi]|uniref:N-(5'-phosphoribosyl)anthranilate isomerase n=1 Tax=Acuticoccus mangrovi TaxID=2796142 RepID=A0A934MK70_9HYPH|nr:phosphoribosylanthranilate isomerase [Acuticoccus mangrovi]MBJ3775214.1 phosphoribosylanthranilate isomerase [Acuticoccus mangrovi]
MRRTRLKVCCIRSEAEAAMAVAAGADAVGLVGEMPTGPGVIPDTDVREIAATVPAPISPWLLTAEDEADTILDHAERCAVTTVQLVRHIAPEVHDHLAERAPWLRRVQVIHVEGDDALDVVAAYGERPHTFLLDSGRPSVAELGGTGRVHDWDVSARIVAAAPRPVFLAGGLNPGNVAEAIRTVRPFGLDLCSGIRRQNRLAEDLLTAFVGAIATTDAELSLT